jgi:hypothetical protein
LNGAQSSNDPKRAIAPLMEQSGIRGLESAAAARHFQLALLIVLVGCAIRIVVAASYANLDPATAQLWEYGQTAIASLKYGGVVGSTFRPDGSVLVYPTAFVPPVCIFIWLGIFKVLGVTRAALATMIALNVVGGAVIVVYTMRIASLLFKSSLVALIAGAFMAIHPVFVYSVATYEQLNLYLPLLLIMFDQCSSRFPPTAYRSIILGVVLALAVLARTEYLPLGMAILIGSALRHRRVGLCLLSVVVGFLLVVPWTVRNYVVFHRFIPVVDSTGYALYKGFDPLANGSGEWVDREHVGQKLLGRQLAEVPCAKMCEVLQDDVYLAAADRFIAAHPFKSFVVLPVRKMLLFWLYDFYEPTTHLLLYQLQFWPLFLLSCLGLVSAAKRGLFRDPDHRMLLIMFGVETAVMAAYAVHARYRMNVEPFLLGYAASGLVAVWGWLRVRLPSRPAVE